MRPRLLTTGITLALACSHPAFAQPVSRASVTPSSPYPPSCSPTSVPASESERAYKSYEAGKVLYNDLNYDAAIAQFREAYKRDCSKHELLIIISRAYELKQDRAQAIRALEIFLERAPDSEDAPTYRLRLENLRRQVAAQPSGPQPPPASTAWPAPDRAESPPLSGDVREHSPVPWIMVGTGAASAITGLVLILVGPKVPSACNEDTNTCAISNDQGGTVSSADQSPAQKRQLKDDQDQAASAVGIRTGGLVALIAGAFVASGGLLWHFLEPVGPAAEAGGKRPTLLPSMAPGYAGASLGGRF